MESLNHSGSFSEISCPRLLVRLHLAPFTGTLRISQGALLKLLYFQNGEIAMASSNDQGDHLAPILMRAGKLKSEQLELARKQTKPGTSLARVLVQMGFLNSGELFAAARQQLRQITGSVLGLTDGKYEIQEGYFPREITSLNVDTRDLLLDLIQELPDRSFVLLEVGAPDTVYFPAPSAPESPVKLPKAWQEYAGRFSEPMTVHAFGQLSSLDDFGASKAVYGLHLLGILETRPAEAQAVPIPAEAPALSKEAVGGGAPVPISLVDTPETAEPPEAPPAPPGPEAVREEAAATAIPEERPGPPLVPSPVFETPGAGSPTPEKTAAGPTRTGATGSSREIVSRGAPIRMEFKDPIPPPAPPSRSSGPWGILSILAGIAILAGAFAWFVFLKGSPAPADVSPARVSGTQEAAGTDRAAEPEASQEPPPAVPAAEAQPPAESSPAPAAGGETPAEQKASAIPLEGNPGAGPPREQAAPPTEPVRESAVTPTAPADGGAAAAKRVSDIPPFGAADRFFEARERLDAGDYGAAAASWLDMVAQEKKNAFTLQIAIACAEESVRKAARRTRGSATFFTVPFPLAGKSCYRLCWGAYPTLEKAQAAKSSVPSFFLSEGGKPVVVSLGKLSPPGKS